MTTEFTDQESWDKNLQDNYYDLGSYLMSRTSYSDWEGFAGPEELQYALDHIRTMMTIPNHDPIPAPDVMVADLTMHWVQANIDEGGYTPTADEITHVYWAFASLIDCRWWRHSDIDWATGGFPAPTQTEDETGD